MKAAILAHCGHRPGDSSHQENGETALAEWQAQPRRFCLFVEHSDELTPSGFVKRIHEALPELRRVAMGVVIQIYINSGPKEE